MLERMVDCPVPIAPLEHLHIAQRSAALLPAIDPNLRDAARVKARMPPCEVFPDRALRLRMQAELEARGILPRSPVVAVQISARQLDQRWPAERFAELIRTLHARTLAAVLLFWSPGTADNVFHPGDDAKAQRVLSLCRGLPIHGARATTVAETIAGFSLAQVMITSDGGAMHIAAGVGLPIVGLFGSTRLEHWHPWGPPFVALRSPSFDVADLSVNEVLTAALTLLGNHAARLPTRAA